MFHRKSLCRTLVLAFLSLPCAMVQGQGYPAKPVRIFASEAGGDFLLRLVSQGLAASLGEQVLIENRPAGVIPINAVARAAPDGHVLLAYTNAMWTAPLLQTVPYDAVRDFAPVTLMTRAPNLLVVHPAVPATGVKELVALAKARPGAFNYGSSSSGSANHLASELLKYSAGLDVVRVPYKGVGPLLNALLAGEVQMAFTAGGPVAPHIKSGKIRALAVASARPSELAPGLPTLIAAGLPDFESEVITGLFAPAGTPVAVIDRLNRDSVRIVRAPETRKRLADLGLDGVGSTPEELGATVKAEIARMSTVIKAMGLRID